MPLLHEVKHLVEHAGVLHTQWQLVV